MIVFVAIHRGTWYSVRANPRHPVVDHPNRVLLLRRRALILPRLRLQEALELLQEGVQ